MSNIKQLQQFKDFFLEELSLINYKNEEFDITSMRGEIYLFEDIFGGPISGSIDITDAMDLPRLFPFIGEERLKIKFNVPLPTQTQDDYDESPFYEKKFRIYNVTDRRPINENLQQYTLHFVSEEFFLNFYQVVQRGFKSKRYSKMVQVIYDEMVKKDRHIRIEQTKYEHNFVAGNMTPFQFFNCIASRSISDEGNGSLYLFYEDQEQFNFITLGKLFKQAPVKEFIYQPANLSNEGLNAITGHFDTQNELINVEMYHHSDNINPIENLNYGMYGSTLWHIDPIRGKYEKQEFKLSEEFDNFVHIDKAEPFRPELDLLDKTDSHIKILFSDKDQDLQEHLVNRDPTILPDRFEESVLQRASQIMQSEVVRITIKVPGDPKLKAGDVIKFNLPYNAGEVSEDRRKELDEYLQGNYLITSLKHSIIDDKYTITMEIIKDTYNSDIEAQDPIDRYIDRY